MVRAARLHVVVVRAARLHVVVVRAARLHMIFELSAALRVLKKEVRIQKVRDAMFNWISNIPLRLRTSRAAVLLLFLAAFAARAAEQLSLDDKEHIDVQRELNLIDYAVWTLVIGLLVFAYAMRYIARRRTRPCPWCMEFISKKESTCPRCGKSIARVTSPS